MEFWGPHRAAVKYLSEIEEGLEELERRGQDVAHYRDLLPRLYRAVFGFEPKWGARVAGGGLPIEAHNEALLSALAGHLDVTHSEAAIQEDSRSRLLESLDDVRVLVEEADYLSPSTRAYLERLLDQLMRALELEETFSARTTAHQLAGALLETGAQEATPSEEKARWSKAALAVITGVITHGVVRGIEAVATTLGLPPA